MQGICKLCSGSTCIRKIDRCKKCYLRESKKAYYQKCANRDNEILLLISSCQKTAAEVAKQYNLSREGIRLILAKNGLNYRAIKREITKRRNLERKKEKEQNNVRFCRTCKKVYRRSGNWKRFRYCSKRCHNKMYTEIHRERMREYYLRGRVMYRRAVLAL